MRRGTWPSAWTELIVEKQERRGAWGRRASPASWGGGWRFGTSNRRDDDDPVPRRQAGLCRRGPRTRPHRAERPPCRTSCTPARVTEPASRDEAGRDRRDGGAARRGRIPAGIRSGGGPRAPGCGLSRACRRFVGPELLRRGAGHPRRIPPPSREGHSMRPPPPRVRRRRRPWFRGLAPRRRARTIRFRAPDPTGPSTYPSRRLAPRTWAVDLEAPPRSRGPADAGPWRRSPNVHTIPARTRSGHEVSSVVRVEANQAPPRRSPFSNGRAQSITIEIAPATASRRSTVAHRLQDSATPKDGLYFLRAHARMRPTSPWQVLVAGRVDHEPLLGSRASTTPNEAHGRPRFTARVKKGADRHQQRPAQST